MDPLEKVATGVAMALLMLWPAILLLLLRRCLRRWWMAVIAFIHLFPVTTFVGVGGIAYAFTYLRVVVREDTRVPDEIGMTVPQYLGYTFTMCGMYGFLIAGLAFLLSVPLLVGWRLLHRRSFEWITRSQPPEPSE